MGQGTGNSVEPWLRGTLGDVDAVRRQVLHALELTAEDADRWCGMLSEDEMYVRPFRLASVAFHLRHVAGSLDRLLTYAEGYSLGDEQMRDLRTGMDVGSGGEDLLAEFHAGLRSAAERVMRLDPRRFEETRGVGRAMLASTLGGLLVHCAEHTQRHAGQMVTTAKVVLAMR